MQRTATVSRPAGRTMPCPRCDGRGVYFSHGTCYRCEGRRVVPFQAERVRVARPRLSAEVRAERVAVVVAAFPTLDPNHVTHAHVLHEAVDEFWGSWEQHVARRLRALV